MIRVVTDSSSDLPPDVLDRAGVTVVPLTIRFGDDQYPEGIDTDQFWHLLSNADTLPETAAPPIGRFEEAFHRLADEGADGIVTVSISSAISATHSAATAAARSFHRVPVRVVDSRLVSAALGLCVLHAAGSAAAGADIDGVEAAAADAAERSNLFATLGTLEFLRRGGRIGGAAAVVGNLLDVKPLISFEDGEVAGVGRVRTRSRGVKAVLAHLAGLIDRAEEIAVIHSDPPDLDDFVRRVTEIAPGDVLQARLGPVIGTHAGPGLAGVAYRLADGV